MPITPELMRAIVSQYDLQLSGTHGVSHWARVFEIGSRLAPQTGANLNVVQLFAVFHDSRRVNEGRDPKHGQRGAELAAELRGLFFDLSDDEFKLLRYACDHHTDGLTQADVTVQTCWDSDRLDLGRVGTIPDPRKLCTLAAADSEMIEWATRRAERREWPSLIEDEWGIHVSIDDTTRRRW